jgi:hypothetical protein
MRFFGRLGILALLSFTMSFGFVGCGPSYISEEDALEQDTTNDASNEDDGGIPADE